MFHNHRIENGTKLIVGRRGAGKLFWEPKNIEHLCRQASTMDVRFSGLIRRISWVTPED